MHFPSQKPSRSNQQGRQKWAALPIGFLISIAEKVVTQMSGFEFLD